MRDLNESSITSKETMNKHARILILGSGPAGLSAALYAARAELAPTVLSGAVLGGQAALTFGIENYPGFPDGIGGAQLGELFQRQAERFGAKVEFDIAESANLLRRPFEIVGGNGQYKTDALIIATGARPNTLEIPGEKELIGKGVSFCATCDGAFFKQKRVIVIGGGDSALEEGLFLTRFATSVTIIHRREILRAGQILQDRAHNNPKIDFMLNTVLTEINGLDNVEAVKIKNTQTGEEKVFPTDGVFIFIGNTPNTQIFEGQIKMENGYIKVDNQMRTNIPGVFAAGEVADSHFRQVITSAGMGAAAAIEATHFLEHDAGKGK